MKTIIWTVLFLFLTSCVTTVAKENSDKTETDKSSWTTKVRVTEIKKDMENRFIYFVQFLKLGYNDEVRLFTSDCYERGNMPVNLGDTLEVLATDCQMCNAQVRLTWPVCQ